MISSGDYIWTQHSSIKMRQYRLTESRVKRIIRHPTRVEEGILENAIACMQPAGSKKYSEIWVMYVLARGGSSLINSFSRHDSAASSGGLAKGRRDFPPSAEPSKSRLPLSRKGFASTAHRLSGEMKRVKVITAWRYPGKSPERDPVPAEVLREIRNFL
jgi:hypothetical protein